MQNVNLKAEAAVEIVAGLPEGWTQQRLWDTLVEAGNDPDLMTRNDDGTVTVVNTKEIDRG